MSQTVFDTYFKEKELLSEIELLRKKLRNRESKVETLNSEIKKLREKELNINREENEINSFNFDKSNLYEFNLWKLEWLEVYLKEKIKSQDNVINQIVEYLKQKSLRIEDWKQPLWSMFFLWSSWVWKTSLIKELSDFLEIPYHIENMGNMWSSEVSTYFWGVSVWFNDWWSTDWGFKHVFKEFERGNRENNNLKNLVELWINKPAWIFVIDEFDKIITSSHHPKSRLYNSLETTLNWNLNIKNWGKTLDLSNILFIFISNGNDNLELISNKKNQIWFLKNDENHELNHEEIIEKQKEEMTQSFLSRIWNFIVFNRFNEKETKNFIEKYFWELIEKISNYKKLDITNREKNLTKKYFLKKNFIDLILEKSDYKNLGLRKIKTELEKYKLNILDFITYLNYAKEDKEILKIW